ncbi:MAG: DUF4838 domain-containing protein, partial [Armatimonadota bacterium]
TRYGAVHFLDRFCGVRFYLPGDLFTSVPEGRNVTLRQIDITREPYVKACSTSGYHNYREEGDWTRLHGMMRRIDSHQHSFFTRFPPSRYAERYPEIYPIMEGKRHIPERGERHWNPCFSEPRLVDASAESAADFFGERPEAPYVSFSVMDTHEHCERDLNTETVKTHGKTEGISRLYWAYMNEVAERLEERFPDKQVVGIVYAEVRLAPPFELHKNVLPWLVFKMSDIEIDKRFDVTRTDRLPAWAKQSSALGHHDWAMGRGYLFPRIYTGYIQETFLRCEELGAPIRYTHAEAYPNWGLDGPKLYLMGQLWWDPHADVEALLRQFCDDMFGPAADPMHGYFTTLEALWIELNNDRERKRFPRAEYFVTDEKQRRTIARCRQLLDQATAVVQTAEQKERVALFSKTFRLSECLFALTAAERVTEEELNEVRSYARENIVPDPRTIYRGEKDGADAMKAVEDALASIAKSKGTRTR